ncbi:uncharacterized protein STEHIDRAFT_157145 [Stereum hirsutum FP-91666 SS1]|uniref:uncharacterized protein n=1 Tax=Stereum hirsutum (strain FP-91666) TaxID=721885 RepID=UPI0004449B91|nr:uncharacterized protein STEHIDRAFT_157145 [Stereum hirsutum FP-91666 SS1]EIM86852.1 hypothetical protein STEHIDRAFT_157145 [Stereum hirsutum FP-91666 SS1]
MEVSYTLPPAIQSIQASYISSSQSAAAVSALIAATDAQLLGFMKGIKLTDPTEPFSMHPGVYNAMLGLNYAGLFLCISATISQLIMTEIFGELPLNAARKSVGEGQFKSMHRNGAISSSLSDLLVRYGARPGFHWVSWHCEFHLDITARRSLNIFLTSGLSPTGFLSLFIGIFVSVLSVLLYIMVEEPMPTKIIMGFLVVYSFIPFLHYFS